MGDKPRFEPVDVTVAMPGRPAPIDGYDATLDRRGPRALARRKAGWAGHFLYAVSDDGAGELLAPVSMSASARWVDDDHVMISEGDVTWVGRRDLTGLRPVAGLEGLSGAITPLGRDMYAIDDKGWNLVAFRGGMLRHFKGKAKPPAGAAKVDRELVVDGERVFAATWSGEDVLELHDWDQASALDPEAEWQKAFKKIAKGASLPLTGGPTRAPVASGDGVVQADGSRWRFASGGAAVEVDGAWRSLALPGPLSGPDYAELPAREQAFIVGRLVHGAVDARRGLAWLVTGGRELLRAALATGATEVVTAVGYASSETRGLFALDDGRVAVVGTGELVVIDPASPQTARVDHIGGKQPAAWGCASVRLVAGDLLAYVTLRASKTRNGMPACLVELVQLRERPHQWLTWELPMYAPALALDGTTLVVGDPWHTIHIDLSRALPWYRERWSKGGDDVPGLPPT